MTLPDILSVLLTTITWAGYIILGLFILAGLSMGILMIALATHKPCKCEEPFAVTSPDKTPQMGKVTCDKCGEWFWEYYSRLNPQALLPEQVEVDEETKSVKLKPGVELES